MICKKIECSLAQHCTANDTMKMIALRLLRKLKLPSDVNVDDRNERHDSIVCNARQTLMREQLAHGLTVTVLHQILQGLCKQTPRCLIEVRPARAAGHERHRDSARSDYPPRCCWKADPLPCTRNCPWH